MDVEPLLAGPSAIGWTPRRLLPAGDDRLARLVAAGSEEAFAALYHRYHQRLYRYCRSIVGNDTDAQDALQSTFAGAFGALAAGRRDAPVRPWLYRIAHNESVSILRRRRPEVEISEEHVAPSASAAEVADENDRLATLVSDLRELTERQRGALVMRELSGLSHAEIATALNLDVSGAKQTIFEARRSLQEFSEGRAMVCDEVCRTISDGGGRALRGRRVRAHLRDCAGCRRFADAIPARGRDLAAIAPPLAGTAALSILRRAIAASPAGSGSAGAGVGAGGWAAGTASTVGSATKAVSLVAAGKALAGAAAIVTMAAGATTVVHALDQPAAARRAPGLARPARGDTAAARHRVAPASPSAAATHRVTVTRTGDSDAHRRHHASSGAATSASHSARRSSGGSEDAHGRASTSAGQTHRSQSSNAGGHGSSSGSQANHSASASRGGGSTHAQNHTGSGAVHTTARSSASSHASGTRSGGSGTGATGARSNTGASQSAAHQTGHGHGTGATTQAASGGVLGSGIAAAVPGAGNGRSSARSR